MIPNSDVPITRIVDGGYLTWTHGAVGMKSWRPVRANYTMKSGSLILMDSPSSARKDFYPDYKSHRKDQHVKHQDTHERVMAFQAYIREDPSLRKLEFEGLEADDLVAILVTRYNLPVIGADKDLLQIPGIHLSHLMGDEVTEENFRRRLPKAIQPYCTRENILPILTLLGDKSDDIPRLIPAGNLRLLQQLLSSGHVWDVSYELYGEALIRNLSLAVLPSPWCAQEPPTPIQVLTSVREGTYQQEIMGHLAIHIERTLSALEEAHVISHRGNRSNQSQPGPDSGGQEEADQALAQEGAEEW